jgi:sugar phosphate isomerase/epimerase
MRLSWDDGLRYPLGKMNREEAKFIYDMGYRVAGVGDTLDISDDDIKFAKDVIADTGLMMGPFWIGDAAFRPDPAENREHRANVKKALTIAGKLECPHLGYSVGSMSPQSSYMHHSENHTQKALDMLIKYTRSLLPYAEDAGCMLCPETTQWTIVGSIERMKEFVERVDSPFLRVCFDPVNHMTPDRFYESGAFIKRAFALLGDCIGSIHCKDMNVADRINITDIDEAQMGTGFMDHETLIRESSKLEPWKTFSLEHINDKALWKPAHDHIQKIADSIGHVWSDPKLTRAEWEKTSEK